jgi:hypothetical protein
MKLISREQNLQDQTVICDVGSSNVSSLGCNDKTPLAANLKNHKMKILIIAGRSVYIQIFVGALSNWLAA